jgi:hypothetical protein
MTKTIKIASSTPVAENAVSHETYKVPEKIQDKIDACAAGSYQEDLLAGTENWSGNSLRGKAASYGASYRESRETLLERINQAITARYRADTALVYSPEKKRWVRQLVLFRGRKAAVIGEYR